MTAVRSAEEFWALVEQPSMDACWNWRGSRRSGYGSIPYGQVSWPGQPQGAHQVAWVVTYGPIPAERQVCHWCANPACCNPTHLWLGTQRQNTQHTHLARRLARYERAA